MKKKLIVIKHLEENNITYLSHMKIALTISALSIYAAICVFIHSIFPNLFENTATNISKKILNIK